MNDTSKVILGWVIGMLMSFIALTFIYSVKVAKAPEKEPPAPTVMEWEHIALPKDGPEHKALYRTRIRAKGWLLLWYNSYGSDLEFIPDEKGSWDKGVDARIFHKERAGRKRINLKRAYDEELERKAEGREERGF